MKKVLKMIKQAGHKDIKAFCRDILKIDYRTFYQQVKTNGVKSRTIDILCAVLNCKYEDLKNGELPKKEEPEDRGYKLLN
jgi:hypothetical protein